MDRLLRLPWIVVAYRDRDTLAIRRPNGNFKGSSLRVSQVGDEQPAVGSIGPARKELKPSKAPNEGKPRAVRRKRRDKVVNGVPRNPLSPAGVDVHARNLAVKSTCALDIRTLHTLTATRRIRRRIGILKRAIGDIFAVRRDIKSDSWPADIPILAHRMVHTDVHQPPYPRPVRCGQINLAVATKQNLVATWPPLHFRWAQRPIRQILST